MKIDVQELEPCKRQLVVEAPEDEVRTAWDAALKRVQRQARLPGFRPGKVPLPMVRAHFADEVRRHVAEQLIPDAYRRALAEVRLEPVDEPEVQDLQLEEGQALRFTAVVEIKPTITLRTYRGLDVRHTPSALTHADVDAALSALAERHATLTSVTRPVRVGDFAIVDYTIAPDGADARREEGYTFQVGSGQVLAEMDEAVIGLEPGDERQLTVRFPDKHAREDLQSKTGRLSLRLVEVKEKELPALDDDFARALGAYSTIAELREVVRGSLETERQHQNRHTLEEAVVDAVLAEHDFAVPDSLVLREVAHRIERAREHISRGGVNPDTLPWDYGKLTEEIRPAATRAVRRALLLDAVAEHEKLSIGDEDVDAEIERLAQESGRAPQAVRGMLQRGGGLDGLRLRLREARALGLLVEHAQIQPAS